MSTHKTSIELEKILEQIQLEIKSTEETLGRNLFQADTSEINPHIKDDFALLENQKNDLESEIQQINNLSDIRIKLKKEADVIKKEENELASGWTDLYEKLGLALSNSTDFVASKEFEPYKQNITELVQKYQESQTALDSLKAQMEGQSFMNKLLTQVQYTAKNTATSQLKKKLFQQYAKIGREIFATGILSQLYESGALTVEISESFALCADLKRKIDETFVELTECNSKLEQNEQQLKEKGVNGNIEKRINVIQEEISSKHEKQQDLCQIAGHDFSLKYVDPDGEKIIDYPDFDKNQIECLDKIADLRQQVIVCRRKIQIIALSDKIDFVNKRIETLQKNIEENEEKIQHLKQKNEIIKNDINLVESDKKQLLAKREELEVLDAASTKLLSY